MRIYHYSKWDGTQHVLEFDTEKLMDELAGNLMNNSDLPYILWKLERQSNEVNNLRLSRIEQALEQLRESKQLQLDELSITIESIKNELDEILEMETESLQQKVGDERKNLKLDLKNKENLADNSSTVSQNLKKLKQLPDDIGGKIKELQNYDFINNEARQRFQELMTASMNAFNPDDTLTAYPLDVEDSISFAEALKLIETLQEMDKLEGQIKDARSSGNIEIIDEQSVHQLLGERAARELKRSIDITKILEEANYIHRLNQGFELTPLAIRKIAQKALLDVITQSQKDKNGRNKIYEKSISNRRSEETKQYEFGDDFDIDLNRTVMNSLFRQRQSPPIQLKVDDFEIYKPELVPRSAMVLMLDLSLSMSVRNNFNAAKQVALALDGLIRSQFPRDVFHIVGFSSYAREIKKEELATLRLDQSDPYTNIQHGLELARKLLAKEKARKKQIIIVTDGEPTAHKEEGQTFVNFSPGARTLQMTLREVENCSRSGIIINTFMLGDNNLHNAFVTKIAQMNKGRVFFTSPDNLGKYVLVDYLANRRKTLS